MNNFCTKFVPNLKLDLAVYPQARVALDEWGKGLILHPSKPPVAPKQLAVGRLNYSLGP
jgi:hypothetical protein